MGELVYRKPKYLSYSALTIWYKNRTEFIKRYIAPERIPREPQGQPASVGSAFDARVKSHLYEYVFGKNYMPEVFSYDAMFASQVEPHNRDFAAPAGDYVFACYEKSGMLQRLKDLCDLAIEEPKFEDKLQESVDGVSLLGYSDIKIRIPDVLIVGDWKVNGFCSNSSTSPNKGYMLLGDGYKAKKQSRNHGKNHSMVTVEDFKGLAVSDTFMEDYEEAWATQTSGYAWMYGEPVGSENWVALIHQVTAKPLPDADYPLLKVSEYRSRVRKPFQEMKWRMFNKVWQCCQDGYFFPELSREESDQKTRDICESTARLSRALKKPDSNAETFIKLLQKPWYR